MSSVSKGPGVPVFSCACQAGGGAGSGPKRRTPGEADLASAAREAGGVAAAASKLISTRPLHDRKGPLT